jgi:hypothetical protein
MTGMTVPSPEIGAFLDRLLQFRLKADEVNQSYAIAPI